MTSAGRFSGLGGSRTDSGSTAPPMVMDGEGVIVMCKGDVLRVSWKALLMLTHELMKRFAEAMTIGAVAILTHGLIDPKGPVAVSRNEKPTNFNF